MATTSKRQQPHRSHNSPENKGLQRSPLLPFLDDSDQVLTPKQWAMLNGISMRTARRILAGQTKVEPPVTVRLSDNRIGVTRAANRAWLQSRQRSAA